MDTGSTGLIASKNHFPVDGLTPLYLRYEGNVWGQDGSHASRPALA
jgi:hypothetical protein